MAVQAAHVDDIGTVFYIDVHEQGFSLDAALTTYTTREVRLKRPNTAALIEVTAVSTEEDPDDLIIKLKLVSGSDTGTTLTGTGGFALPGSELGDWIAEVLVGDGTNQWTSDPFILFNLRANLS